MSQTASCIKVYALVANKVFHESWHIKGVELTLIIHIEVFPGAGEVLINVFIKGFSANVLILLHNHLASTYCLFLVHFENARWLTVAGLLLEGEVGEDDLHELVLGILVVLSWEDAIVRNTECVHAGVGGLEEFARMVDLVIVQGSVCVDLSCEHEERVFVGSLLIKIVEGHLVVLDEGSIVVIFHEVLIVLVIHLAALLDEHGVLVIVLIVGCLLENHVLEVVSEIRCGGREISGLFVGSLHQVRGNVFAFLALDLVSGSGKVRFQISGSRGLKGTVSMSVLNHLLLLNSFLDHLISVRHGVLVVGFIHSRWLFIFLGILRLFVLRVLRQLLFLAVGANDRRDAGVVPFDIVGPRVVFRVAKFCRRDYT